MGQKTGANKMILQIILVLPRSRRVREMQRPKPEFMANKWDPGGNQQATFEWSVLVLYTREYPCVGRP